MSLRFRLVVVLGFLLGSAATVLAPPAMAGDDDGRSACGPSGSTAEFRMNLTPSDDYRLTVTFAVFSNDLDEWNWKLIHNDEVSARGESQARDADRSFRVVRRMIDAPGVDSVVFRAENSVTHDVCRGTMDL